MSFFGQVNVEADSQANASASANGGGSLPPRVKPGFAPREVAHGALPGSVADNNAVQSHASLLKNYDNARKDQSAWQIRNARSYEAAIPTAGQAPRNDERFIRRLDGTEVRNRNNSSAVGDIFTRAAAQQKPAPKRVNLPTYNTIQDSGAIDKTEISRVPQNTTRRQKFEYTHHTKEQPHKAARPVYGYHNDSRAPYNILSNEDTPRPSNNGGRSGAAGGAGQGSHAAARPRRTANHTEYTYNIVSGEDMLKNPNTAVDPRIRANPVAAPDRAPVRRQLKTADQTSHTAYDVVNLAVKPGEVESSAVAPAGKDIFGRPKMAIAGTAPPPQPIRRGRHPEPRDFNIVSGNGNRAPAPERRHLKAAPPGVLQAQREKSVNTYIFDANGKPMRHMRRRPAEYDDHVTDVLNQRPPPRERNHIKPVDNPNASGDSVWGLISPRNHTILPNKDGTRPRGSIRVVGDHHSNTGHTDRVWFESNRAAADGVTPRPRNTSYRPRDNWQPGRGGPTPPPVRQRPGPADSINATISHSIEVR